MSIITAVEQLDALDRLISLVFILVAIGLPVIGYWFAIIDFRAYLRSLKRMLVKIMPRTHEETPDWILKHTPPCIQSLGLQWPCTEQQVKDAYRRLAETYHPDLGGDKDRFLRLHSHYEEALRIVRQRADAESV